MTDTDAIDGCDIWGKGAEGIWPTPDDELPDELTDADQLTGAQALGDPLSSYRASGRALWLPAVLRGAGLRVAVEAGWEARGRQLGAIAGVICHHTAGPRTGNAPSLRIVRDGRPGLAGPLSQLVLARDGLFIVVAAGRANHAGTGEWRGITDGNGRFLGIEAENTGLANDQPWPAVQLDAYARGVAAILRYLGRGPEWAPGHKEYALPRGRKPDPTFNMPAFRSVVAGHLTTPTQPQLPERVRPMFDPPHQLQPIVDAKPAPEGGTVLLGLDGSLYAYGGAGYPGGANGQPWFAGRRAARLDYVGDPSQPLAPRRWRITAHTGETYHVPVA